MGCINGKFTLKCMETKATLKLYLEILHKFGYIFSSNRCISLCNYQINLDLIPIMQDYHEIDFFFCLNFLR